MYWKHFLSLMVNPTGCWIESAWNHPVRLYLFLSDNISSTLWNDDGLTWNITNEFCLGVSLVCILVGMPFALLYKSKVPPSHVSNTSSDKYYINAIALLLTLSSWHANYWDFVYIYALKFSFLFRSILTNFDSISKNLVL